LPKEITLRILHAIRDIVGPEAKGVGPDLLGLMDHEYLSGQDPHDILLGIREAESFGFAIALEKLPQGDMTGYPQEPVELRSIYAVHILMAGQEYLD